MKITQKKRYSIFLIFSICLFIAFCFCKKKDKDSGSSQSVTDSSIKAGDFVSGKSIKVPMIAWGADLVTINANGSSPKTVKGSIFDEEGLNIELFRQDDFSKQTDMFIRGEIVYLRGTMGMMNMASEKLHANDKTKPVLIYQHSWSSGGDALVVKGKINSIKDLKGKTVAIQSYGPHVDYFLKLMKDAQLKKNDVKIVWTKDLIGGQGDTPMAKLYTGNIDAAFVIIPDALALTSNGTIGTGAEDSVKGARILLSTKTANRIISDVYAVRKDYFDKNKKEVKKFVKALLRSEEQVKDLFKTKSGDTYNSLLTMGGKLLLDDPGAKEDVKGMYNDAELTGFNGNVKFFSDAAYPRNYKKLSAEIQNSLISLGLINKRSQLLTAKWDYNELKKGLRYADAVSVSKFDTQKATIVAEKLSRKGGASLFQFEIFFQPNQNNFSAAAYQAEFDRVIDYASTYGGALITVEGHSDPMAYLRKKKKGGDQLLLKKIKQSAKNLSYSRAGSVRDEIISYSKSKSISLDTSQFTIIGHGISSPKFGVPKSDEEWRQNMRVQFKIIQVEAEEQVFKPL
ncbi:MAG: ABC transporter substrate-binding protein [bacterium]|nr:ABC transporter substrate-binding protein [bacterium]